MRHVSRPTLLILWALGASCGGTGEGDTGEGMSTSGGEESGTGDDGSEDWGDDWGDDSAEPSVESHVGAIEELGISGPDKPWGEMSADEQEWYMIGKVLPIMKEVFARHDAERWAPASYGCETCHGPNMRDVAYRMPADNQYRVPERDTPAWRSMERIFPDVVRFMEEEVTPTMGTLLGIEGYTCTHCHPSAGSAPARPARPARRGRR